MPQGPRLTPDLLSWWGLLHQVAKKPGRIRIWTAAGHPPDRTSGHHLHATATSVLCLRGSARLSHPLGRLDLSSGDAVVIQAGAWHRHEELRPGSVVFLQGILRSRSDFTFMAPDHQFLASVPEEPSHGLMERIARTPDETQRRPIWCELLDNHLREAAEPLVPVRAEIDRMERTMWSLMSRPGNAEDVLRAAGISRAQAYRLFTDHLGMPPARALLATRLTLAKALLDLGLPVTDVAIRCGFPSRQTFSRAYRRTHGDPPTQHRVPRPGGRDGIEGW